MGRKLVKDMTPEEYAIFSQDLQEKKNKIRAMSAEERVEYEKKRQRKWSDDYIRRAYDTVNFRVPKGGKQLIKDIAEKDGSTFNNFIRELLVDGMKRKGFSFDESLIYPKQVAPTENE